MQLLAGFEQPLELAPALAAARDELILIGRNAHR
jgi:hypothetical protein